MKKILFIRRDNIGDLLCTTPAIRAVRERYPDARIAMLVNSYNADAVRLNPDIDEIHVYQKAKHVPERSRLAVWWENSRVLRAIRREHYDVAIACGAHSPTLERYTARTGARRLVGFAPKGGKAIVYTDPVSDGAMPEHEVARTFRLLGPLGEFGAPGRMYLYPDAGEMANFADVASRSRRRSDRPLIAVAISARVEKHQWQHEKFASLIERLLAAEEADVLLLWAPGAKDNPTFPGDDEAAAGICEKFGDRITPYRTTTLPQLIAALASADLVVSLDTGSLHMASALQKPLIAIMRNGNIVPWGPWQTINRVIASETVVSDIPVESVYGAVTDMLGEIKLQERGGETP
ncbi:MAG: glycosyltransferase family 9 protein [Geobacter sp.]|nr:glycosyltransferase family 9 protein [Geobacter sp.]